MFDNLGEFFFVCFAFNFSFLFLFYFFVFICFFLSCFSHQIAYFSSPLSFSSFFLPLFISLLPCLPLVFHYHFLLPSLFTCLLSPLFLISSCLLFLFFSSFFSYFFLQLLISFIFSSFRLPFSFSLSSFPLLPPLRLLLFSHLLKSSLPCTFLLFLIFFPSSFFLPFHFLVFLSHFSSFFSLFYLSAFFPFFITSL